MLTTAELKTAIHKASTVFLWCNFIGDIDGIQDGAYIAVSKATMIRHLIAASMDSLFAADLRDDGDLYLG